MVARVRRRLLVLLALSACPGAGNNGTLSTTAGPGTGPGVTSTGDEPTGGTTDACVGSGDCDSEGICVADYEAVETTLPAGMRDAAECVAKSECIGALDLDRWCFDHRSCCENLRCQPADGTCEPRGLGQTTGDASTTGDADTGTTSTGTSGAPDTSGTSGG